MRMMSDLHPGARACVRSGYCCKVAPCPFGKWSEARGQCDYLVGDRPGRYACGKFDEIMSAPPEACADIAPAFGAGCCSPMNSDRRGLE